MSTKTKRLLKISPVLRESLKYSLRRRKKSNSDANAQPWIETNTPQTKKPKPETKSRTHKKIRSCQSETNVKKSNSILFQQSTHQKTDDRDMLPAFTNPTLIFMDCDESFEEKENISSKKTREQKKKTPPKKSKSISEKNKSKTLIKSKNDKTIDLSVRKNAKTPEQDSDSDLEINCNFLPKVKTLTPKNAKIKVADNILNSTFAKNKSVEGKKSLKQELTPKKIEEPATPFKLDRTNTFIKESPSQPNTLHVTRRRKCWDKSRASSSFLDDMFAIADTSASWQRTASFTSDSFLTKNIKNNLIETPKRDKHTVERDISKLKNSALVNSPLDKKIALTPPSNTSTPFANHKKNLLRQALLKQKRDESIEQKNISKISKPAVKRTKLPNFAKIHERAYEKMENLKEMSERKASRARMLLSGKKPEGTTIGKSESKRALDFSQKNDKPNLSVMKVEHLAVSKSNPKVLKSCIPLKNKGVTKMPTPKKFVPLVKEKDGFTKFGFKMREKTTTTKEEQVKAVANKTRVKTNAVETRREIIKGVRSNRRFEMLMKMREK